VHVGLDRVRRARALRIRYLLDRGKGASPAVPLDGAYVQPCVITEVGTPVERWRSRS
jgi:hypothetical protein